MRLVRFWHRALPALLLTAALLPTAGCDNPFKPRIGYAPVATEPPPRPNSPTGLMNLFRWCWENRSITEYEDLFTEDFRFVFSDIEAVDNPPILRDEEIAIARRIFVDGGASEPRAKRIEMTFVNQPLIPIPDTRPDRPDPWYKLVQTRVRLTVELAEPTPIQIDGDVNFFLVRGDSAQIPLELQPRLKPDPGRWYIQRWEDKTGGGSRVVATLRALALAEARARARGATAGTRDGRGGLLTSPGLAPHAPVTPQAASAVESGFTWGTLFRLFRE